MKSETLLLVQGLTLSYASQSVLYDVSLSVSRGEVVAVIGASGAGKSALLRALLGLVPSGARAAGKMWLDGTGWDVGRQAELGALRGRTLALVPQDPAQSLPPHRRIGALLTESLRLHRPQRDRLGREFEARRLLSEVGLDDSFLTRYPHTLSGGQGQRVLLALALAGEPQLLLADEPTSALDPVAALGVLQSLKAVARDGRAVLLVSHDLTACARVADRIVVLAGGYVVEAGPTRDVLENPIHPYVRSLIAAARALRFSEVTGIPGELEASLHDRESSGCVWHGTCPLARERCAAQRPRLESVGTRQVACHAAEDAR
jgi:oligopeptide/dipeptide ABC transporter ATP-binding protein